MKARIGENVIFPWDFSLEDGDRLLVMKWEYSKTQSFETSSVRIAYRMEERLFVYKPFRERASVELSGALTLRNVSIKDSGFYKCHIVHNRGELQNNVQLYVGGRLAVLASVD